MALRQHFGEKLTEIRSDVVRMGTDANEMVRMAMDAALNGDRDLAARVISADDRVDASERTALQKTVLVVLSESPVAADLRFLISTLGVVGEIEKVGDHAVKLSRRATKLTGGFPAEMKGAFLEIGELARRSFSSSLRLYTEYSPELATEIVAGDEAIDKAYSRARSRVFELIRQEPQATESLVRTMECFHALEHVADNAVAIAVRMSMLHSGA